MARPGLTEDPVAASAGCGTVTRTVRVRLRPEYEERGLLAADTRAQALRKALIQQPGVRHLVTDRVSFDATVEPAVLDGVAKILGEATWLVTSVAIE